MEDLLDTFLKSDSELVNDVRSNLKTLARDREDEGFQGVQDAADILFACPLLHRCLCFALFLWFILCNVNRNYGLICCYHLRCWCQKLRNTSVQT